MVHIFSVYALDINEEGYGLSVDVSDVVDPKTLKRIAQEVADQLNSLPDDEFPETDGDAKTWDVK